MANDTIERIMLFDGVCNLCNTTVQFIIRNDPDARFHFCSLQSEKAHKLLGEEQPEGISLNSIVLIEGETIYLCSTAALRIARKLRFPWRLLSVLLLVPVPIRDIAYRYIARNRYRIFGRRDACTIPTEALKSRFLS